MRDAHTLLRQIVEMEIEVVIGLFSIRVALGGETVVDDGGAIGPFYNRDEMVRRVDNHCCGVSCLSVNVAVNGYEDAVRLRNN